MEILSFNMFFIFIKFFKFLLGVFINIILYILDDLCIVFCFILFI